MKFLLDAQLPIRLAAFLNSRGHDALHTSETPGGNKTTDREIADLADAQERVVVSKDRDFRDSHFLVSAPRRLLVVSTGNIMNAALVDLVEAHLDALVSAFSEADFIELGGFLSVHPRRDGGTAAE